MALFLLILVATDASALVGLITRFTEEAFATLISVVFIIQAFQKLYEIGYEAPITIHPEVCLNNNVIDLAIMIHKEHSQFRPKSLRYKHKA